MGAEPMDTLLADVQEHESDAHLDARLNGLYDYCVDGDRVYHGAPDWLIFRRVRAFFGVHEDHAIVASVFLHAEWVRRTDMLRDLEALMARRRMATPVSDNPDVVERCRRLDYLRVLISRGYAALANLAALRDLMDPPGLAAPSSSPSSSPSSASSASSSSSSSAAASAPSPSAIAYPAASHVPARAAAASSSASPVGGVPADRAELPPAGGDAPHSKHGADRTPP